MRWMIGEFSHETNTFCPLCPGQDEFSAIAMFEGEAIAHHYAGTNSCIGGFMDIAARHGVELLWTIAAHDTPSGLVQTDFYNHIKALLLKGLERPVDGVLLSLHGAMAAQCADDAEGDILQAVRQRVGPDVPIAATLDFHANVSPLMAQMASILVGYKTYPHIDEYEVGIKAADLLHRAVRKEIHPRCVLDHPPLLMPLGNTSTMREPMRSVMDRAREIERSNGALCASVFGGFPYADILDAGMSSLLVVDGPDPRGEEYARELSMMLWDRRRQMLHEGVSVRSAIAQAMQSQASPVVLADISDNPGGGGLGDDVEILRELLNQRCSDAVVGPIWDPQAAQVCHQGGLGTQVTLNVGSCGGESQVKSVTLTGRVTYLGNGDFTYRGPMCTGTRSTMGSCAVVDAAGIKVLISAGRLQNLDPEIFRCVGIEPTRHHIVAVKSSIHFRAAYEPLASKIIEVDAPGLVSPDMHRFTFRKVRRPIYPLDEACTYPPTAP